MMYEGLFIEIMFSVQTVCFTIMSISFILVVLSRQQPELFYGQDLLRKRKTIVPNFKNFKNIKYCTNIQNIYTQGEKLGEGNYGAVYKVTLNSTGHDYAMKVMPKESISRE